MGENSMKYVFAMLFGMVIGAVAALLFAPTTGEEMRSNIQTQATTQYEKGKEVLDKGVKEVRVRLGKDGQEPEVTVIEEA
jgi:gas vesicle protein